MAPLQVLFARLEREQEKCDRLDEAGWMPFEEIEQKELRGEHVSALVERYYRENWAAVAEVFRSDVSACEVDDEAKAAFDEALEARRMGLYRASSRTLFPEIERVSRIEIHGGSIDKIASQKDLLEAVGALTPGEMAESGIQGMQLYYKLVDHLYAHVRTQEELSRVIASPVPNRHVALHGHHSYATLQSSLNAIIMCDYIFRTISISKRRARGDEPAEAG